MFFWMIVKSALKSLTANKLRSILAMLGIIIGVAAVIAMLAIGAGAQQQITSRFQAMGTNLLFVRPAQRGTGGVMTGVQQNLVVNDALAVADLPGVAGVSPVVNGRVQAKYMNRNTNTQVNGVSMVYFDIRNMEMESGRRFSETEAESMARVAVIGTNVAQNLFASQSPVNATIKINGINFKVVGVLKSKGDQGWSNPDDQILVPYTTAMKILFGLDYLREIDVGVLPGADINTVSGQPEGASGFGPGARGGTLHKVRPPADSLTGVLRKRHRLNDLSTPDDFIVQNMSELLANLSASITTFRVLLGAIAAISLLVGGIGIMNIMLVSVTERTREIGVRKAVGAKDRDILGQFLIEACLMCGLGGLLGVALGVGGAHIIPLISKAFSPVVQLPSVLLALGFSAMVGIFFGFYPAYRAAALDPIESLRYE